MTAKPSAADLPRRKPGQALRQISDGSEVQWFVPAISKWPTAEDLDDAEKARIKADLNAAINTAAGGLPATPLNTLTVDQEFADRLITGLRSISGTPPGPTAADDARRITDTPPASATCDASRRDNNTPP